jgi:signal transduction histidine kinase
MTVDMKSRSSNFFRPTVILTVSIGMFLLAQTACVFVDYFQIKHLQDSICKSTERALQTGAIRDALDTASSNLKLTLPSRPYQLVLSEGDAKSELGSPVNGGILKICTPAGRTESHLYINVQRRGVLENSRLVAPLSLLASFLLLSFAAMISRKTQELTADFFESELASIFAVDLERTQGSPFLSRFFDLSKSDISQRARRNISDLKSKLESQAGKIKDQSVKAALGDLIAHVAHDMRSPLSLLSVISSRTEKAESRELMNQAIDRLNNLAEEVLNTRKNLIVAKSETTELRAVIAAAVKHVETVHQRKVLFDTNGFTSNVRLNAADLSRVLSILLENALESEPSGAVRLYLELDAKANFIIICIEDDGPGFPTSILDNPPSEWYSSKANGNGLGLKFVQSWCEINGGELQLRNRPGKGASVKLHLPI